MNKFIELSINTLLAAQLFVKKAIKLPNEYGSKFRLNIFFVSYLTMKIVEITKERLMDAQKDGYTVLITKLNSDPLSPTWIFDKIDNEKIERNKKELHENYQLCYSIKEAIHTIDNRPFIGKLQLIN